MNTTLADTAPDSPRSDAAPAAKRPGEVLLTLVRRELWEHRALWLAPLVLAGLLALVATIGRVHIDLDDTTRLAGDRRWSFAHASRSCRRPWSARPHCR